MKKKNINNISTHNNINNNTRFKNRQRRNAERLVKNAGELRRGEGASANPTHHVINPHENAQTRSYVTPYICSKSFAEIVDHNVHVSHTRPTFTHMLPIAKPTTVSACTTPNILKIHQKCYLDPAFNKPDLHKTHETCDKIYMDTQHGKSDNTPNIYIINNLGDKQCNSERSVGDSRRSSEKEHQPCNQQCIPECKFCRQSRLKRKQQRLKRKQQRLKRRQSAKKHQDDFEYGDRFCSGRGSRRNSEHNHRMDDSRLNYLDDPRMNSEYNHPYNHRMDDSRRFNYFDENQMNSDYDQSYNNNHYYCSDTHHCGEPDYEMQYNSHCGHEEYDDECDDDESYDESDEECYEECDDESNDCDTDNETLDNSQSDNTECDHTHEHCAPDDTFTKLMKNLYHEVGDAIKCILKAFAKGSGNLDELLEYENYSALSDKLYALKYENNVDYERFRNILIDAVEGAKKNNNRIGEQDDAYKKLKKLYDDLLETKRKGPSILSAEVQLTTVAVIRPEILEYIRRGYKLVNDKNEQIPLDMDVLAEIRKELHIHSEPCDDDSEGEHHHAE